jgi:GTP cyclohydrolase II
MHSECLTGDMFGSLRCDCGKQLKESMNILSREGGILLYLRQEGRGIGLYHKLEAYKLQDNGYDTFEANRKLNFPEDARSFECAAQMLKALDIHQIRLISNNPHKRQSLEKFGIRVEEVVNTGVFANAHNMAYLKAKAEQHQHTLPFATPMEMYSLAAF